MAEDPKIQIPLTPSEPPSVKVIAARGAAWQMVIAQFSEFIGLIAITYALVQGKLSEQTFGYLFCGCLSGRFAQQVGSAIRGKPVPPLPTTTLVSLAAVFALAVTLGSCAGEQLREPDWAQVRNDANAMRVAVNEAVDEATQEGVPKLEAVCAVAGEQSAVCAKLRAGYELARSAVKAARATIDAYDATGIAGQDVHVAIARVKALADEFADAAQAALEVVQHDLAAQAPTARPGDREPAPEAQSPGPGAAQGAGPPNAAAPANAAAAPPAGSP